MHIITQLNLFSEHENLGDLEKLETILSILPDDMLIKKLQDKRKNGRNDYPIICMWRLFLAKFIFQHDTIESLLRECHRNSQLRIICGLQTHYIKHNGIDSIKRCVPSSAAMSRFIDKLKQHQDDVQHIMNQLVDRLKEQLPEFTKYLAVDGKIIPAVSHKASELELDGRRDTQADTTAKSYIANNGSKITKYFFGYRVHLLADVTYELPIAFKVTPASCSEQTIATELLDTAEKVIANKCYVMADKGYDSEAFREHIENKGACPIIPPRHMWKEDESRQYLKTKLYYNQDGQVWFCNDNKELIELCYKGYDESTNTLRYGFHPKYNNKKIFRIKRSENVRIFPKVAQTSHKFRRLYNKRSGIERINGRLDRDFKFEKHFIRGLDKMTLFVSMSFITMLGFAYAKVSNNIIEHLSSWVA